MSTKLQGVNHFVNNYYRNLLISTKTLNPTYLLAHTTVQNFVIVIPGGNLSNMLFKKDHISLTKNFRTKNGSSSCIRLDKPKVSVLLFMKKP